MGKLKLKRANLVGKVYYRLLVLKLDKYLNGKSYWLCKCICGKVTSVSIGNLQSGNTHSCGCYHSEKSRIQGHKNRKHGEGGKTSEYCTWQAMKQRCYDKNAANYRLYGGRGIQVCKRWRNSYENFLKDRGRKPTVRHSLDRINPNGNYTPKNTRWATPKEQSNNRRCNVKHNARLGTLVSESKSFNNSCLWKNTVNTMETLSREVCQ